jgi:prepilin-type N-terminal cleavage/methylation domain-containing protein
MNIISQKLTTNSSKLKASKGFTLIEVLIVVGIIGLLASVVLSGLGSVRSRGRDARRAADLRQVQQGLELYYTREQFYPNENSWDGLRDALKGANIGITNISNDPLCRDNNDTTCENYEYITVSDQEYILKALLEDKQSPLAKDSYEDSECGKAQGDRFVYCIKF